MIIHVMLCAAALQILPPAEMKVIERVAAEYRLTQDETHLLIAIRKVENGKPGLEFGIAQNFPNHPARRFKDGRKSFLTQARWAAGTIKNRYHGDLVSFSKRYCPPNHANWRKAVTSIMRRYATSLAEKKRRRRSSV